MEDLPFGGGGGGGNNGAPCDPDTVYFQQSILPLLVTYCSTPGCHDAVTHEEDVRLYEYGTIMEQVEPGDPWDSDLFDEIIDGDMPPDDAPQLSAEQVSMIQNWILQGAQNNGCSGDCDTTNVTYSATIAPLLQQKCNGCHGGANPQGGYSLTSWGAVNTLATEGRLLGAVQHQVGYTPMPPAGGMLPQCDIDKIAIWVQQGAPNN
ncbi:MAG: c-type cytochrome [Flavobacteriales bacterium]|nr:c-type cytochrome [Flavobacteriales bacterium]